MDELLRLAAGVGGVGGLIAVIVLYFYRHLGNQMREDRKFMEDRLDKVISAYNTTIANNTRVLTELITWLKAKNGSK